MIFSDHFETAPFVTRIPGYDHPRIGRLKIVIQEKFVFEDYEAYIPEDRWYIALPGLGT